MRFLGARQVLYISRHDPSQTASTQTLLCSPSIGSVRGEFQLRTTQTRHTTSHGGTGECTPANNPPSNGLKLPSLLGVFIALTTGRSAVHHSQPMYPVLAPIDPKMTCCTYNWEHYPAVYSCAQRRIWPMPAFQQTFEIFLLSQNLAMRIMHGMR